VKELLAAYFTFSKKERRGITTILVLIVLLALAPLVFPFFIKHKTIDPTTFKKELETLQIKEPDSNTTYTKQRYNNYNRDDDNYPPYYQPASKSEYNKGELFYFDPNTASTTDWKRLGLRDKTINTIQNYLSKGGHFYKPEDIGKIWGLHKDEVERLLPYVQIGAKQNTNSYSATNYSPKTEYKKEKAALTVIDINTADTTVLIALPGIGSKLAQRIINFRNKLGGFYSVAQVGETFGLPDSTFQKIKPRLEISTNTLQQFNINTATIDELKVHPYIKYNIANAIVQYRNQHGNFSNVAAIKNIMIITDEVYNKIAPYLITQ
jgi:competence protein ComEA